MGHRCWPGGVGPPLPGRARPGPTETIARPTSEAGVLSLCPGIWRICIPSNYHCWQLSICLLLSWPRGVVKSGQCKLIFGVRLVWPKHLLRPQGRSMHRVKHDVLTDTTVAIEEV